MEGRSKVDIGSTKEGNKTHDDADNEILTGEGESSNNSGIPRKIGLNWLQPWKKIRRGEHSHADDEPQEEGQELSRN